MLKNIFKIICIFIIGTVGGIFADQILWPYFIEKPLFYQYRLERTPIYVTEKKEITIQENVALGKAAEKVEKVIVGVRTKTKTGKILEGSGIIVTSDGLILTLSDLMPQGGETTLFWEGTPHQINSGGGQILKRDLKENLVLAKIKESNLPTVGFADFEKIKLGERVFLVGTIFEKGAPKKIINEGIIKIFDENFIQTNIFEKKVLEGSPLFDIEGNLLGLNLVDKEGKIAAIPISKIKTFLGF